MNPFIRFMKKGLQTHRKRVPAKGSRRIPSMNPPEETPTSPRIEALISFFKTLENRKSPGEIRTPPHWVEQSEEAYQKEQARWMAGMNRTR